MNRVATVHPIWVLNSYDGEPLVPLVERARQGMDLAYTVDVLDVRESGVYVRDPRDGSRHFVLKRFLSFRYNRDVDFEVLREVEAN